MWSFILLVVLMRVGETPVPIPNTEVKPNLVDDTASIWGGKVDCATNNTDGCYLTVFKRGITYKPILFLKSLTLAQDER